MPKLTKKEIESLEHSINHIFESGANEVRIVELIKFIIEYDTFKIQSKTENEVLSAFYEFWKNSSHQSFLGAMEAFNKRPRKTKIK